MRSTVSPLIGAALLMLTALEVKAQDERPDRLAVGCLGCHGLKAKGPGLIPGLTGLSEPEMRAAYAGFASGQRPGTVMPRIVRGYTPSEWDLIARYFSQLSAPP